jgi:ATP-dependent exoDNAse (exonuclease V) beta subunit
VDDKEIIEGIADLTFRDEGQAGWTVVDFKTDMAIEPQLEEYRAQLAIYLRTIARATGEITRGVLLWV